MSKGRLGLAAGVVAALAMTAMAAQAEVSVKAAPAGAANCTATSGQDNRAGAAATSQLRAQAGLPPVRASALLAKVAAAHACDMARRGTMAHSGSRSKGPAQRVKQMGYAPRVTAENIAAGPFGLGQVLGAWNGSPGHRDNIMIPQVRDYGIGRAVGADGKTVFWAAVYAAPKGR